jgi:hypothetical protein
MKCFAQSGLGAGGFFSMAVSASLILRGFIGQPFSIFVNMMTLIAFLNLSGIIVIIVSENSRRPPLVLKTIPPNHHHIFLGNGR